MIEWSIIEVLFEMKWFGLLVSSDYHPDPRSKLMHKIKLTYVIRSFSIDNLSHVNFFFMAVVLLAQTASDPLDVHGDKYLQMSVKIQSCNNSSSWDLDEEFEEPDLSVDEQTCPAVYPLCKRDPQSSIYGLIDIILHPTYQVPCPYIRLFDSSGQPITESTYQVLMERGKVQGSSQITEKKKDGDELFVPDCCDEDFGDEENRDCQSSANYEVIYEEHPYKQIPCLCVHVCGLLPRMELLESIEHPMKSASIAKGYNTSGDRSTDLPPCSTSMSGPDNHDKYFLHWLVLMGPTIGLHISTDLYNDILMMNSI